MMHHTIIGSVAYEFMCNEDASHARALYRRFIGTQTQFESAMEQSDIMFARWNYDENRVYRVDPLKARYQHSPFCVVADNIYDAIDWAKSILPDRGIAVTNMRGW